MGSRKYMLVLVGGLLCATVGLGDSQQRPTPVVPDSAAEESVVGALIRRAPLQKPKTISRPAFDNMLTVKFRDDLKVRAVHRSLTSLGQGDLSNIDAVNALYGLAYSQLIQLPQEKLDFLEERAADRSGIAQPDLAGMMVVHGPEASLEEAARELLALDEVEWVDFSMLQPDPPCADIAPATLNYYTAGWQSYHNANPGLNMAFAWGLGARGQGVLIADCEYGYIPGTEDLCNIIDEPGQTVHPDVVINGWDDHGTATIGEMAALDNAYGCTGLSPDATQLFFPEKSVEEGNRRVTAITNAIATVNACDIVLLEMQTINFGTDYGPAELNNAVWTVVKNGTDAGVIVVGAAGNGNQDLDSAVYGTYQGWGDSGAILVGAGTADLNHDKVGFSTYGSRVNLQAWGDWSVFTLGYGNFAEYAGDNRQRYTHDFSGTSSASPMVTSCAAALQSLAAANLGCKFGPRGMRQLLMDTGIAQGAGGNIGPIPDMLAASLAVLGLPDCNYGGYDDECAGGCGKHAPAGDDCWSTQCGNGTSIEFGSPEIPAIPADFFGPGSDPFTGVVELGGNTGFADTVISRLSDMCFDGPLPASATTPIEMVQLDLIGCQPITVTYNGGTSSESWTVRVFLNGQQPQGLLTATKENPLGGTFDSNILVRPAFEFIGPNGPPGQILTFPPPDDTLTLSSTGLPWVQDMPPSGSPCGGIGFFPGFVKSDPTCCPWSCHAGPSPGHDHCVAPPKCPKCPSTGCVDKPAPAGDDCWNTVCGNGTEVQFGSPEIPAIPADFFGPNSDPFTDLVELGGQSGFYDTIISRLDDMCFDGTPPVIDQTAIELVALDLIGCQPITVTYNGGLSSEDWTVRVLLDGPQPQGMLTATKVNPLGGTFDSDIQVRPAFEFTGPPPDLLVLVFTLPLGDTLTLSSTGLPWVQDMPPSGSPCGGIGFFPGFVKDDTTCCPWSCHAGPSPGHDHCVAPPDCPKCPTCVDKPAPAGDDCWSTQCGNGTSIEFGSPDIPTIPADFFGPNSDPFADVVELGGPTGFIDTIISRLDDMCFDGTPPVTDQTAIEIVQLDLIGCQPITVTYLGGQNPEAWTVRVYLDGPQPQGMLTATKQNQVGGTFDSDIQVIPGFEFTGPTGQQALLTPGMVLTLASTDLPWIQYAPPGGSPCGNGGFYPGFSKDDETCCPPSCHAGPSPGHDHCVQPPKCQACDPSWFWKDYNGEEAGGYIPDFDQNKDYDGDGTIKRERFYCGPTAVANSIWWFDNKFPGQGVIPTGWTKWDLIEDLAHRMATQANGNPLDPMYQPSPNGHLPPYGGTYVDDMQSGIFDYLNTYGLTGLLYEHTEPDPDFNFIATEVQRSQDVTLLVGFWHIEEAIFDAALGGWNVRWRRTGGHYITVAGVNKTTISIAVSDPDADAAEQGFPGVVRGGDHDHDLDGDPSTIPGFRDPGYDHTKHNKKIFASHDYYDLQPSFSPGGQLNMLSMGDPLFYGMTMADFHECNNSIVDDLGNEVDCDFDQWWTFVDDGFLAQWGYPPPTVCQTYTEIEHAVVVSPVECEKTIIVEIMTDDFPGETTWEIVDKNSGGVVASGGPYTNPNTLHSHAICADPTGCYNFTIFDSFGDGLCCAYGNGYYNVYFQGGLVGSGDVFGFSETVRNIGWDCRIDDCFPSNLLIDVEVDGVGREIIALSSVGHPPAVVERDPPPYVSGADIGTEMIALELSGNSPMLGPILLRESPTQASTGAIVNVLADGAGNFLSGDSFFDVFAEIELANIPDFGIIKTKVPHRVVANGITALPPVGVTYHWSGACKGDLDENGVLDGRDIQLFIDCVMGWAPPAASCQLADMDKDGDLDMDDVTAFVNNLLNKVCLPSSIPLHVTLQPNVVCLVQPFNQLGAWYSDVAAMQFVAENFVLSGYGWIGSLEFYGGYDGGPPPDDFKITFYTDAGGLPGQIINQRTPLVTRTATGLIYPWGANQYEYTVVFDPNKELLPGSYWIEISNDTTATPGSAWYWEFGNLDTVKGLPGAAFSGTNPKPRDPWFLDPTVDMALEIICKDQGPQKIEIGRIWSIDHVVKESKPGACCLPPTLGQCGTVPGECITTTVEDCVCRGGNFLGENVPCTQVIRIVNHAGPPSGWSHEFVTVSNCDPAQRGVSCVNGPYHIDPWTTAESGSSNCENFDPAQNPEACPIPADFFGPGSDPFDGTICFKGEPLGMVQLPGFPDPLNFGEADTLVRRDVDPFDRCDLPSPGEVTVDIEIVELSLISCEPITVDFADGSTEQWDVEVDVVNGQQPGGSTLTAGKEHCNGGTFDSVLNVCPRFTFTKVLDPTQVQVLDYCADCNPAGIQMSTTDVPWVHDPSADLGLVSPVCSDFHPGLEETDPLPGCDCNNNGIRDKCDIEANGDCNGNGVPDDCDVDPADPDGNGEVSGDCNNNGIPDECEPDCQPNGIPDECDIAAGTSLDCNGNGIPDECELVNNDCNDNGIPDECDPDCNDNGIPDECDPDPCVGACCDDSTGVCNDGVPVSDCPPPLRYEQGTPCADLMPPCGPVAAGACCLDPVTCIDGMPEIDCLDNGGTYMGDGVLCDPLLCEGGGVGACCLDPQTCLDGVPQADCEGMGGTYMGDGVLCDPVLCEQGPCQPPPTCPADLNCDGIVDNQDEVILLNNWGPCPPPCPPVFCLGDLDGNCIVDATDMNILLSMFGPCL